MAGDHFSDPAAVARYVEGPPRTVPGFDVLHRLTDQLLAEAVPDDGRVLVVGAGGGLELAHLAERHAGWRFDGVDPSAAMLDLARRTMGPHAGRATLTEGLVRDAAEGPFDGACCLLVLHFVDREVRLATLREIRRRLRPGSPLVVFHHSVPRNGPWLERSIRFASGGADARERAAALAAQLPILSPEEDEALLGEAGFTGVGVFYAALSFRGWVAHA